MAFKKLLAGVILLLICICKTESARILLLLGPGEGSHYYTATAIGEAMVKRGHNVTVLISDLYAYRADSQKDSQLFTFEIYNSSMTLEKMDDFYTTLNRAAFKGQFIQLILTNMSMFNDYSYNECDNILRDTNLLSRLKASNYDLILVDMIFNCPLVLVQYLDRPFIFFIASTVAPHAFSFRIRLPINPAYIPDLLSGFNHNMGFQSRLKNTIATGLGFVMNNAIFSPYEKLKLIYKIRPDLSMYDTLAEADLWFLHSNVALDFPRPLMPNVIPIGGLTTKPANTLPDELEQFMQSSGEHGVILFSMGTYVLSMEDDVAEMFAEAFAAIPQKVIWKLGGSHPPNLPDNVKLMKWIPQNDILGHKKVRAFVMHCGVNGVYEALYHSVPLICLPLFGDQHDIAARVVSKEIGVQLDVSTLTSGTLAEQIRTVLEDNRIKDSITKYSKIFRDAPQHPSEVGADWMEYVLRHGGAGHLHSAALDLNAFQYLLIDVILVISIACILLLLVFCISCKFICRKCIQLCGRNKIKTE